MNYYLTLKKRIDWLYEQYKCLKYQMDNVNDQNNLLLVQNISYDSSTEDFIDVINTLTLEVSDREILVFNITDTFEDVTFKYVSKVGKGNYGNGGTPLTLSDLEDFNVDILKDILNSIDNIEEALGIVDEYLKSEPIKLVLSLPKEDIIAPTTFAAYNVMNWNGRITDLVLECDPHNRPTGSTIIVDVLKNGTSILFTPITIDIGGYFSLHAAVQPIIADDSFIIGDIISADILQEGSTDPGQWLQLAILTEKS